MIEYITASDLDNTTIQDKEKAAFLANLYMNNYCFKDYDTLPDMIKQAAIVLAENYSLLYADKQTGLLSESATVAVISESKTFSSNAKFTHGFMLQVSDMLKPYLCDELDMTGIVFIGKI